jgi:hypothetical protein
MELSFAATVAAAMLFALSGLAQALRAIICAENLSGYV